MKFSKYSTETVAELLVYLAEHEAFASAKELKSISKKDINEVLNELAAQLRDDGKNQPVMRKSQLMQKDMTEKTSRAIGKLSPSEEEVLLRSFKISE